MIDFANLKADYLAHQKEFDLAIKKILNSADFIMGEENAILEKKLCDFVGCNHALTCSNGTIALILAFMALGIKQGDEVITTSFSFFASAEAIAFVGAKPIFVDIDATFNLDIEKIPKSITKHTKAILAVSLFGQIPDMDSLNKIARKHNLWLIEDGAQSFGSTYKGRKSGNIADITTTSFFPAKPLGCFGDGGAIFCNHTHLYQKLSLLRTHGQTKRYKHTMIGMNARLDNLQASILNIKLNYYPQILQKRQDIARLYQKYLHDTTPITLPIIKHDCVSNYAQFSILADHRDALQKFLKTKNIPSIIHYPIPLPYQEAFSHLKYNNNDFISAKKYSNHILSLPLNPYMTQEEVQFITQTIKEFYG